MAVRLLSLVELEDEVVAVFCLFYVLVHGDTVGSRNSRRNHRAMYVHVRVMGLLSFSLYSPAASVHLRRALHLGVPPSTTASVGAPQKAHAQNYDLVRPPRLD